MFRIIYAIIIIALSLSLYSFKNYKDLSDISEKETLFLLDFKGYTEYTHVLAYQLEPNHFYLPLMDYIQGVHFDIKKDKNNIIKGSFYKESNNIIINPKKSTISINKTPINFKENQVYTIAGKIYVDIALLEQMFDIKITPDFRNLILSTYSNQLLPIEYYNIKERNRKYMKDMAQQVQKDFYINKNFFNSPTLDFYTSTHYFTANDNKDNSLNNSTTISLGGTFLGFDANISTSKTSFDNNAHTSTDILFSKTYVNQPLGINYVEFGDIYSPQDSLLSNNTDGRGLYMSSSRNYEINQNKTVVLEGDLLPGWDVELYKNGQIIDYKTQSLNGRYSFTDIPVDVGNNNFKLVFYSPYGTTREETKNILVGATPVEKGELGFTLTALQPHRKIIENSNEYEFFKNQDAVHGELATFYGITSNLALSLGYSLQQDPQALQEQEISDYNSFYSVGAIYSIYNFSTEANMALTDQNSQAAYQLSLQGNTRLGTIYTNYEDYNSTHSQKSYDNFQYIADFVEFRYGNYLKLFGSVIPFYIGHTNKNYDEDSTGYSYTNETYIRTQYTFLGKYFTSVEAIQSTNDFYTSELINTLVSTNYKSFSLRGNIEYQYHPDTLFDNVGITLDYRPNNTPYYWYIEYNHYYNSLPIDADYYRSGVSWTTRAGNFNASVATNANSRYDLSIGYNVSLGYNQISRSLYLSSDTSLIKTGNVEIKIFEDLNNNNVFDKNIDRPIPNATIKIDGNPRPEISNTNGTLNINSLSAYQPITISLNDNSLDDIMLEPKILDHKLMLRPNIIEPLNFALVNTGDIEGVAYNTQGKPFQYAKIELFDEKDNLLAQSQTDNDGLFIIERIPYGSNYYMIITDPVSSIEIRKDNITINSSTTYIK